MYRWERSVFLGPPTPGSGTGIGPQCGEKCTSVLQIDLLVLWWIRFSLQPKDNALAKKVSTSTSGVFPGVFFFNTLSSRHKQTQQLYQNRFYSRPCDLSDITTVRPGGCRAQPREYNIDEGKDRRQKSTNWYSHVPRLTSNNLFQIWTDFFFLIIRQLWIKS